MTRAKGTKNPEDIYLDLMKKSLTYSLWNETWELTRLRRTSRWRFDLRTAVLNFVDGILSTKGMGLARRVPFQEDLRREGRDWPAHAHTMIGYKRLDNIQSCIEQVLRDDIPGDLVETGVWRGGATIFMRAILKAYGVTDRTVWAADSFAGLPSPNPERYPDDAGDTLHTYKVLAVSLEEVRGNFERYGLLDDQVRFLRGWFRDTLPGAPIEKLAVMRLDGDMYESTMDALVNLYPKLSPGGYVIIDDFALPGCRKAVQDFREQSGIAEEIQMIDWTGAFWRRSVAVRESTLTP